MAEQTTQFRAALHGYNREDVVDYIDRMTQEHEDTVQRLQKSITKMREELAEANEAASHAKAGATVGSSSLESQAMIAELRKSNDDLKERIQNLKGELEQAREARPASDFAPDDHDRTVTRLQEENDGLRAQLDSANEALSAAKENAVTEKELSDARFLIGELQSSDESQKERIQSLEAELGQIRTAWKNEMDSVQKAHDNLVEGLRVENTALRSDLNAANEALASARENTDTENALLESKLQIEDLHIQNEELAKQLQTLHDELESASRENETLRNRVQMLEAEAEQLSAARDAAEHAGEQLHESAMETLRTENAGLREELNALHEELDTLHEELNAAQESGETQNALLESTLRISDLSARNEELDHQLRTVQDALNEATRTNEALRACVQSRDAELEQLRAAAEAAKTNEAKPASVEQERNYAEMELAAYRRAEQTERLARERAEQTERQASERAEQTERQARAHAEDVYRQVQSVFGQANENMNGCHADLEQLCCTMRENVNEMLSVLSKLNGSYRQTEDAFAALSAQNSAVPEG